MLRRVRRRTLIILFYFLWILFALYPNPTLLFRSIPQAIHPRVQPAAVQKWANQLPNDPEYIENQVLTRYMPYEVPWQTMGVPWYFPTTAEAVKMGRGDCEARMVVLASILKAKGIPFKIEASLDHIWVQYPHKRSNVIENSGIEIMVNRGHGPQLQRPKHFYWRQSYVIEREYYWDPMPLSRKIILFGGLFVIFFRRRIRSAMPRLHLHRPAVKSVVGP